MTRRCGYTDREVMKLKHSETVIELATYEVEREYVGMRTAQEVLQNELERRYAGNAPFDKSENATI